MAQEVRTALPQYVVASENDPFREMSYHAESIWNSILAFIDPVTSLPRDALYLDSPDQVSYPITSPTNMGLLLLDVIAAEKLGYLNEEDAHNMVEKLAKTYSNLDFPNGLPGSWYDTQTTELVDTWPTSNTPYPIKNSSVDTAWFLAGVYGASQVFPNIPELNTILNKIDLGKFYNSDSHLFAGELSPEGDMSRWVYGAISEARIISYMGVALGQIPSDHLEHLWNSARRIQEERCPDWPVDHPGTVPTWRGNIFERAMLLLILDENNLSPIWNTTHNDCIQSQQNNADPKTGLWGFSPSSAPTQNSEYVEYGVPDLGLYPEGSSLGINADAELQHVITPHALYLTLCINPQAALQGINLLASTFPNSWSRYGFPDSINTATGATSRQLLILDQSMAFLALAQHLNPECVRQHFKPLEDKLIPYLTSWIISNES